MNFEFYYQKFHLNKLFLDIILLLVQIQYIFDHYFSVQDLYKFVFVIEMFYHIFVDIHSKYSTETNHHELKKKKKFILGKTKFRFFLPSHRFISSGFPWQVLPSNWGVGWVQVRVRHRHFSPVSCSQVNHDDQDVQPPSTRKKKSIHFNRSKEVFIYLLYSEWDMLMIDESFSTMNWLRKNIVDNDCPKYNRDPWKPNIDDLY